MYLAAGAVTRRPWLRALGAVAYATMPPLFAAVTRKLEKAPRQIGVGSGERSLDFPCRDPRIENRGKSRVREQRRIVLGIEQCLRFHPARDDSTRCEKAGAGDGERNCDPD